MCVCVCVCVCVCACVCMYNCRAMVDMLIVRGGRKLMLLQDAAGDTCLHLAARADQPSAIEVCVCGDCVCVW